MLGRLLRREGTLSFFRSRFELLLDVYFFSVKVNKDFFSINDFLAFLGYSTAHSSGRVLFNELLDKGVAVSQGFNKYGKKVYSISSRSFVDVVLVEESCFKKVHKLIENESDFPIINRFKF